MKSMITKAFAFVALTIALVGCSKDDNENLNGRAFAGSWIMVSTTAVNSNTESAMPENNTFIMDLDADGNFAQYSTMTKNKNTGTYTFSGDNIVFQWTGGSQNQFKIRGEGEFLITDDFAPTTSVRTRKYKRTDLSAMLSKYSIPR